MATLEMNDAEFERDFAFLNGELSLSQFRARLLDSGMPNDEIEDYIDALLENANNDDEE